MRVSKITREDLTNDVVDRLLFEGLHDPGTNVDCIIVLGSVKAAKYRVPAAAKAFFSGRSEKVMLCGGKMSGFSSESMAEADDMYKRALELGIPEKLVYRQPFPGPGLAIRIIGEVTAEKIQILQEADAIYREEIANAGLDKNLGQYFAALTNMRSVGVMGDERTYDYAVALRAVNTSDFMTAETSQLPWEVLGKVTSRIVNEVKHVNRVLYDCTGKPPATIEFE